MGEVQPAADETATEPAPVGKGRPTPKRSEARKQRRAVTPTNRKEAAALRRKKMAEQRTAQREALRTGDERYLPARDAGPAKRLARDYVDGRFTIGQVFFGLVILVLFLSFVRNTLVIAVANLVMLVLFVGLVVDSVRIGRGAKHAVAEKYGEGATAGITSYALMRAMQPRRMRRPPARVGRRGASG